MYIPGFNAVEDDTRIRELVDAHRSAELVTTGRDGYPLATLLPVLWHGDVVVAHMARANPHWKQIEADTPVLLICGGPQAYISPTWYAAKAEHGRVVPTWNYSTVHLSGRAQVHEDPAWLREAVTLLTDRHEGGREPRWRVTDAPEDYVTGQLRGIVGIEIRVEKVEAKAKLSQNRSEADRRGVVAGLRADDPSDPVASAMDTGLA